MANNKNLKPQAHKLTVEEQSKGGQKSAEVRREKRQLREDMTELLKLPVADMRKWNKLARMGVDIEKIDNNMLLVAALFLEAANGDVSAFKEIRDLVGEKTSTNDGDGILGDIIKAVENIE